MDDSAEVLVGAPAPVSASSDDAFVELLSGDLQRIQRIARLLVRSASDAEDLVAEAIARSLPRWQTGQVDDLPAYVRRVAVNLASARWRRRALSRRRDHHALDWLPAVSDSESNVVERDRTVRAVMRLPLRRRAVVVLRFYDDMSESQIAEALGINVGTVKSQLSRALEQLRRDLVTLDEV